MDEYGVLEGISGNVSRTDNEDTKSFPEACVALFRLLVARADIVPDSDIVDIGSGCGDSTHLLSQMNPRTLRGVTSESSQAAIARRRFPNVQFIHADAVEYIASLGDDSVDRIFALDCAYHFSSRQRFLEHSARVLRRNGRIAMTDLILGENVSLSQRLCLRLITLLTGAPYFNFKRLDDYCSEFITAGFGDVKTEDISEDVFVGLQNFIHRHREDMTRFGIDGKWMAYLLFARVLRWWWDYKVVRFILVNGRI